MLCRRTLLVLANDQVIAALNQFEILEHVHAEQYFVDSHALDNTGFDVVELDVAQSELVETCEVRCGNAIGGRYLGSRVCL